jgi:UDP-glucose 4-epimerase
MLPLAMRRDIDTRRSAVSATALVTGGAGFIGSNLVDALLASGVATHVVDNLSNGKRENVPDGAGFHELDIRDADGMREFIADARPDVVYHLAAQADVRKALETPTYDAEVNIAGTINVLEAARHVGARVVFSSTGGAAYGEYEGLVIPSPETAEPRPLSHYGMSKLAGEGYIGLYGRLYGLESAILRLGNVYGPRQDPHGEAGVVAIFCGRLLDGIPAKVFGDGLQTRDYVYVGDVVQALRAAAEGPTGVTLNIGTSRETTVLDLVSGLGFGVGPEHAPARAGELQRSALDASLAGELLAWRAEMPLAEGLAATLASVEASRVAPGTRAPGFMELTGR